MREEEIEDFDPFVLLELPSTRLFVVDTELQRLNRDGSPVFRLPLKAIQSIEYTSEFEPISLIWLVLSAGLSAIAAFVSENNIFATLLYVGALLFTFRTLLGFRSHHIVVRSTSNVTRILISDARLDGEAFVNSLRELLNPLPPNKRAKK